MKSNYLKNEKEELQKINKVLRFLMEMQITINKIEHPQVRSCFESKYYYDKAGYNIENYSLCKNIFIRDKRGNNFWLVIVNYLKKIDMVGLRYVLESSKLGPATIDNLSEILNVSSGSVSLFNIINDCDKRVKVIIDSDLENKKELAFHPNNNCQTIFISFLDAIRFLKQTQHDYQIMDIPSLIENQNTKCLTQKF